MYKSNFTVDDKNLVRSCGSYDVKHAIYGSYARDRVTIFQTKKCFYM